MRIQNRRKKAVALIVLFTAVLCFQFAFAATSAEAQFKQGITDLYWHVERISLGAAAIALAGCGLMMVFGNQKEAESAKGAIKYILIAVAGIWLLPLIINAGKGLFGSGWDPHSLG